MRKKAVILSRILLIAGVCLFISAWESEASETAGDVQYVEGFSEIVVFSNEHQSYPDYRGAGPSWFGSLGDSRQEVAWRTALVPQQKETVFVFTATNGEDAGEAELYVNGEQALTFESGIRSDKEWMNKEYKLRFDFKGYFVGNSGVYYLTVPIDKLIANQKCELRVVPISGEKSAWFMIKGYTDTLIYEGIEEIQPDVFLGGQGRSIVGSEAYIRARLQRLRHPDERKKKVTAAKTILKEGKISAKENQNYCFLDSPSWSVIVEKSSGMLYQLVNLEVKPFDVLPPTANGLVIYLWNKDKEWFSVFNRLTTSRVTTGKEDGRSYVRFTGSVDLEEQSADKVAQLQVTYTLWEDRLDIQARIDYLKDSPSSYELGFLQSYEPNQWVRQLIPVGREITAYKILKGLSRVVMRYADINKDHTFESEESSLNYPFGILEREDRYLFYGALDLAANTVVAINNVDCTPSFLFSPSGISKGGGYSFDFIYKTFPKSSATMTDILRWYIENMRSTNPLTEGIVTYSPHRSRVLVEPGNLMLGYDVFWIPKHAPELKSEEEKIYDALHARHFWWSGWRKQDETWPVGVDTEEWVTDIHDPEITMTTEKLQQIIKEARAGGNHLYFYFRQIYYPDMIYDDKPPFKHWMRTDKKYFTMPIGDFRNDEYRNWYIENVKKCIDFFQPDGIAWDLGWHDDLSDRHGVLRMQYEVHKWLKEKHPDKRIILNEGGFSPSTLYADAVMFESGDTGVKNVLNVLAAKAFNVNIINLSYAYMFENCQTEHIHSLMRSLSYGATWAGEMPHFLKQHPGYDKWRSLYLLKLAGLASFSAQCNSTPLVTESNAVSINPRDEKLTASVWADSEKILVAVFNDSRQKKSFELKLNKKVLAEYGSKGPKTFRVTLLGTDGLAKSERMVSAGHNKQFITMTEYLGTHELLLLESR